MNSDWSVLDPTAEASPVVRERLAPATALAAATVGLFSIAKERSDEFMDCLEALFTARGIRTQRFAKATHTKTAAEPVLAGMVESCDVVVGGLAD